MKIFALSILLFFTGISAITAQNQYRTLDKDLIEKKTYDAVIMNDQAVLSNYFTVYKIFIHSDNKTKLNNSSRNSLLNEDAIKDVATGNNPSEFYIYSTYKTDPRTIKNALYSLDFKFSDYQISYATKK